ncbi:MAG: antitoxin Xre/MbcA/ParS toxin-binding domain-containing protein [Pseudomonadota bacterium]
MILPESSLFTLEVEAQARGTRAPAANERLHIKVNKKLRPAQVADLAARITGLESSKQVALERAGLPAVLLSLLAGALGMPRKRLLEMLAVSRASVEEKISSSEPLRGDANRRTFNLLRLLAQARELVDSSTAPEAAELDVGAWLGRWIETPQPALGGQRPSRLLDTETGTRVVERALGALRSGAYV